MNSQPRYVLGKIVKLAEYLSEEDKKLYKDQLGRYLWLFNQKPSLSFSLTSEGQPYKMPAYDTPYFMRTGALFQRIVMEHEAIELTACYANQPPVPSWRIENWDKRKGEEAPQDGEMWRGPA